jgi:hypothetical protein
MAPPVRITGLAFLVAVALLAGSLPAAAQATADARAVRHVVYDPSDEDVPNPDRGFFRQYAVLDLGPEYAPLSIEPLRRHREEGISLIRVYFLIDEFSNSPLSQAVLDAVAATFETVRAAGLRIIPRFAYSYPCRSATAPCTSDVIAREGKDPPLDRVLQHISQLAVVLRTQADVIAFMEVGFVGAWGEWHSSSSNLVARDRGINKRSRAIVNRVLTVLDPSRMVALRYPYHKQALFGPLPLDEREAFSGTPRARVGAHNDCFVSSPEDTGTYSAPNQGPSAKNVAALHKFLSVDNRFLPQGGETCSNDDNAQRYTGCPNALAELRRLRWSTIHIGYSAEVIDRWRREGCLDEIRRRLGYRFRLIDAEWSLTVVAGGRVQGRLRIANDGWAAPYNATVAALVLRERRNGTVTEIPLALDLRRWSADSEHVFQVDLPLPATVAPGEYDLLMHVADPDPRVRNRPEYSVRFANDGLWEAATGFNDLRVAIEVKP